MQRDMEADTMPPDGVFNNRHARNIRNESRLWKRVGGFVVVSASLILAAGIIHPKKDRPSEDTHNYVRTYGNQSESIKDQQTISRSEIYTDRFNFDDVEHVVYGPTISYHPYHPEKVVSEKVVDIEAVPSVDDFVQANPDFLIYEGGDFDPNSLYDPYKDLIDNIWSPAEEAFLKNPAEEAFFENSTIQTSEDDDGNRLLQGYSDYLYPLPCNEGVSFDCTNTLLSSLPIPPDGPLFIECGTCVRVDISDGGQLELPKGLRIEGMLYFPPESSLTIRTTHVHVLGILKMDLPLPDNKVKISLYGEADLSFVASDKQDPSRTTLCQGVGCDVGRKHIAVLGGEFDPDRR